MAYDLFFGIIPKSWARETPTAQFQPATDESTVIYTPEEKAKLEKLASIEMKAESGDRKARRQWKSILASLPSLKAKAKRGDLKARRTLLILKQNGFLQRAQVFSDFSGNLTSAYPRKPWTDSEHDLNVPPRKSWTDSDPAVKVGPRKLWTESESDIKIPPRKSWTDSDPAVKVGPRKPWEDDKIDKIVQKAKKGDVLAQIALRKIAAREAVNQEEISMSGKIGSSHYIEIQGTFTDDERQAQNEDNSDNRSSMGDSLSHNEYRALVVRRAMKNAGSGKPQTKHFFAAKSAVDKALGNANVTIEIPGARPGRRTI